MGGERNHRREMEPSDDRLTEQSARLALLSAQRPARAAQCDEMPTSLAHRLYPKRMEGEVSG
jgi:hypothetical protein